MNKKKRKKSDEDVQEYFAEEDSNKNDDKISFGKVGCSRLNPEVRWEHLNISFHGNCLNISHTRLLCLPGG